MISILFLGFSSGLPFPLLLGTLQAWMTDEGISIQTLGVLGLIRLPYSLKFLWAPFLDRYFIPHLGRRRGWMLITQLLLAVLLCILSEISPRESLKLFSLLTFLIAFFSASQDIVIDAFRIEALDKSEYGAGSAIGVFGWRLGWLASGAGALSLAATLPWSVVYKLMAGLMLVGAGATVFSKEPEIAATEPGSIWNSIIDPLLEFFKRAFAWEILAFMVLYKLGDVMALQLNTRFYLDLGFSKGEIAAVAKFIGMTATIAGGLFGGVLLAKYPLKKCLIGFGVLQAVSILVFVALYWIGHNVSALGIAVAAESICIGLGTSAYVAYMMRLCNVQFTATQYALLSSISQLSTILMAPATGYLVASIGWSWFFLLCAALAIPGLCLVAKRFERWEGDSV
jgi:PAT family beta-lactamase induction signal transducer AmpG